MPIKQALKIVSHPFPSWQFQNSGSPVQGINIDVLNLIAMNLGVPIHFVNQPWARAWITIKRGGRDALISVSRKVPKEPFIFLSIPKHNIAIWDIHAYSFSLISYGVINGRGFV